MDRNDQIFFGLCSVSIIAAAIAFGTSLSGASSEAVAAWVQAVGSIAAIIGTVWAVHHVETRNARREIEAQRREAEGLIVRLAKYVLPTLDDVEYFDEWYARKADYGMAFFDNDKYGFFKADTLVNEMHIDFALPEDIERRAFILPEDLRFSVLQLPWLCQAFNFSVSKLPKLAQFIRSGDCPDEIRQTYRDEISLRLGNLKNAIQKAQEELVREQHAINQRRSSSL